MFSKRRMKSSTKNKILTFVKKPILFKLVFICPAINTVQKNNVQGIGTIATCLNDSIPDYKKKPNVAQAR